MSDVAVVVGELQERLHARVDGVFLPLSVRQNRIEDVFLDFLAWLAPASPSAHPEVLTATEAVNLIIDRVEERRERVYVTTDPKKLELIKRWIASELVVHPAQTNRTTDEKVSFLPLHSAIALHVAPPGQTPAYGRFISELLTRRANGFVFDVIDDLSQLFNSTSEDLVTDLLAAVLGEQATPAGRSNTAPWSMGREHGHSLSGVLDTQGNFRINSRHFSSTDSLSAGRRSLHGSTP